MRQASAEHPLYIPIAVTVVEEVDKWRSRRDARRMGSVPQFRPAAGPVSRRIMHKGAERRSSPSHASASKELVAELP